MIARYKMVNPGSFLVFGARGSLGSLIATRLEAAGHRVIRTTSSCGAEEDPLVLVRPDSVESDIIDNIPDTVRLDGVVWAHGANENDGLDNYGGFDRVFSTNVRFILDTVRVLVSSGRVADGANMVVISSIYENRTRPGKLSYTVSKSALGGLVRSLGCDAALASRGILINGVCPGPIDNAMTRRTLTDEQMGRCRALTCRDRMLSEEDVWNCVAHLLMSNTGVNGQSIVVDLGMSAYLAL